MNATTRFLLLLAVAGLLGGVIGFLGGRVSGSAVEQAFSTLTETLDRQVTLSTFGPVVSSGIAAACAILGAVLVPAVVTFVIHHQNRKDK